MKNLIKIFVFAFILLTEGFTQSGIDWQWMYPRPHGLSITNVERVAPSTWYCVGIFGLFQKTTDDGQTWQFNYTAGKYLPASDNYASLYDLHFFDLNNGIAVGASGTISKTTDGGTTWQNVPGNPLQSNITLYQLQFVDNQTGFACGSGGTLLKTTDGGNNWSSVTLPFSTVTYDIWSPDGVLIIVPTTVGSIYRSTNGGSTWTMISLGSSFIVTKLSGTQNDLYLTGSAGNVRRSTNGGASWVSVASGIPNTAGFNDVDAKNGFIYLTGPANEVYRSTNQGSSWQTIALSDSAHPVVGTSYSTDVSPGGDSIFIVAAYGQIFSKLGVLAPVTRHDTSSIKSNARDIYVSPGGQTIFTVNLFSTYTGTNVNRSTDGGQTWLSFPIVPGSTDNLNSLDMLDSLNGYTVSLEGGVFKTSDGGASWSKLTTTGLTATANLGTVDFTSLTTGWILVFLQATPGTGILFKTTDGGHTWTNQSSNIPETVTGLTASCMLDSLTGWVGGGGKLFSTTNGGATWKKDNVTYTTNYNILKIRSVNNTTAYALNANKNLFKTTDGGGIWDTVSIPSGLPVMSTIEIVNETTILVPGNNGYYILTTDGGNSWIKKNTGALGIIAATHRYFPSLQATTLFICGEAGTVMKTTQSVLPVELTSFSANSSGRDVLLKWTTASELNNSGFEIERKSTSGEWVGISFIRGKGTTTGLSEYVYTDKNLSEGDYSYRLKQIDHDGTSTCSYEVEVEIGAPETYTLSQNFPNPFNPSTVIRYALPVAGNVELKVYNSLGEVVKTLVKSPKEAGYHEISFIASDLPSGLYLYELKAGSFSSVKKMLLVK